MATTRKNKNNFFILCFSLLTLAAAQSPPKPHIVVILADDLGWADVSYHRPPGYAEIQTPNIDALVQQGVELDRHYAFKFCSPSRCAFQTGRFPQHVNVLNNPPGVYYDKDPVSGFAGIPRNMTGIASKMKLGGYSTHHIGKWDAGMATPDHTPQGRGYDTSFGYYHHMNDYYTESSGDCLGRLMVDLFVSNTSSPNRPAYGLNGTDYEDALFIQAALDLIYSHNTSQPLFLNFAPHSVHGPLEVPEEYVQPFMFINDTYRRTYNSMVSFLDFMVGNITEALVRTGMWENTLVLFSSDNGGPIYVNGTLGANNYPLKGGKMNNWEGGIRVNAFVSGGFVPENVRGTLQEGYVTLWDWYATFCALAGVDPYDERAALANLPPVDSVNVWPLISGLNQTSPRVEIPLGTPFNGTYGWYWVPTEVNGLIYGQYKILTGDIAQAGWTGPEFPNTTTNWISADTIAHCETGCLYNIFEDPTEHTNLASDPQYADILLEMQVRLEAHRRDLFSPFRGLPDPKGCEAAVANGDFWVPFLD